ncbi:MAG: hypothetical protein ABIY40_04040 [Rhodanobacteraceae bacterium]
MNARDIPEIKEAEALLRKAELTFPSFESSQLFKEASEILNDFLQEEDRGEQVSAFVGNLKHSYAHLLNTSVISMRRNLTSMCTI